jgi:membrane associated rhomboid family serine protease
MGTYDRDYAGQAAPRFGSNLTPVTKWLIIANVVIYFGDMLFLKGRVREVGAFSIDQAFMQGKIWQLITFQFLHGSVGHVLSNCLGLFVFGPWMERWWGAARFTVFYLLCGIAGALFFTFLLMMKVVSGFVFTPLIGASAGVFGILAGTALIAPNMRVMLLFPPVEMSMRQLACLALAIAAGMVIFSGPNAGGEAGHLGGAILGFLLVKMPGLLRREGLRSDDGYSTPRKRFGSREAKIRPRTTIDLNEVDAVDRILEKVHEKGVHSLTDKEKEILNAASNKKR